MTIEEMHIGIDMDLQKVYTYTQKNLLPQEKDFFLNGEVLKFIKQRTNPLSNLKKQGSDETTKRLEDLSDLTKTVLLDVDISEDGKEGVCILPDDYYSYISSISNIYQLCEDEELEIDEKLNYVCKFPLQFPTSPTTLTAFTITLNDSTGDTVIFDIANLPSGYIENVDINKQIFILLKALNIQLPKNLDTYSEDVFSVYWQRYKEDFYNNEFIITSETSFNSITVTINTTSTVYQVTENTLSIYDETSPLWGKNRLVEDESQDEMIQSNLSQSRPDSPVISLSQAILTVQIPDASICQKVRLRYTSKPTILDLLLKENLNMKDAVCKEIVSNTVRFLKGVFKGDYETYFKENVLVE